MDGRLAPTPLTGRKAAPGSEFEITNVLQLYSKAALILQDWKTLLNSCPGQISLLN
jgi:hypothetical protein